MRSTLGILAVLLAGLVAGSAAQAQRKPADDRLKIVASFTILADMARQIGGDRVVVQALVGPDGDAHAFQPTPADARAVAGAAVLIVNGMGFEGWIDRLKRSAGFKGREIVASAGVATLTMDDDHAPGHGHGAGKGAGGRSKAKAEIVPDPHAWQDLANGQIYVDNILAGLVAADPANAAAYRARAGAYKKRLADLDAWVRAQIATVPAAKRKVITTHEAFQYFGRAYGIAFLAATGVSNESQPSAAGVARLIGQMRKEGVKALFIENISNPKLIEQIARDGGGVVGGALYADALSPPGGPADSYEKAFRHNVATLLAGMAGN